MAAPTCGFGLCSRIPTTSPHAAGTATFRLTASREFSSHVLRWTDWKNEGDYKRGCRLRGEVMTLARGTMIASDSVLHGDPRLPVSLGYTTNGVREHFGITLHQAALAEITWTTAHADLHWGNITGPSSAFLTGKAGDPRRPATTPPRCTVTACCTPQPHNEYANFFALFWTLIAATSRCCSRYAATCGSWTRAVNTRR